jgi:hypothetical protein
MTTDYPVGLFALTFNAEGVMQCQVRIERVQGDTAWCLMYSWLDGCADEVRPLPHDAEWTGWTFYEDIAAWRDAGTEESAAAWRRDGHTTNPSTGGNP